MGITPLIVLCDPQPGFLGEPHALTWAPECGSFYQLVAEEEVRDLGQEGNQCAFAGLKTEGSMNRNGGD